MSGISLPRTVAAGAAAPGASAAAAGATLGRIPSSFWNAAGQILPGQAQPHFGEKVQKAAQVLAPPGNFDDVYRASSTNGAARAVPPVRGSGG